MALVDLHYAFITFIDSRKKPATMSVRISAVEAAAYFGSVTQILKDGTPVGQLLLSFEALSAGAMVAKGVRLETVDDAVVAPLPDANVYHFDKVLIHYSASLKNHWLTIPSRDDAAYTVASDGTTVILDDGAAVADLVARFNAVVLPPYPETADSSIYLIEVTS